MGRSPCCEKVGLKKGPWTQEEDQKLLAYIQENGHGSWRALPTKAGLQRCGKSCRLRWTNYLRPDIKRGKFSLQEEQTIIQLHALLGNRWSAIATHLPKRTDNEIKNYWNTHLKKRLSKMGIDPVTHKPKSDGTLIGSPADAQSKSIANLSHMAQWESARLEAEARLVRHSKLRAPSTSAVPPPPSLQLSQQQQSLDLDLEAWQGVWPKPTGSTGLVISPGQNVRIDLQSPTSTLSFSASADNRLQPSMGNSLVDQNSTMLMCRHDERNELEDQRVEVKCFGKAIGRIMSSMTDNMTKDDDDDDGNHRIGGILLASAAAGFSLMDTTRSTTAAEAALWINPESSSSSSSNMIIRSGDFGPTAAAGLFTELLLDDKCIDKQNSSEDTHQRDTYHRADHEFDNNAEGGSRVVEDQDEDQDQHDHESNNYWNNILDLMNPSNSPPTVF